MEGAVNRRSFLRTTAGGLIVPGSIASLVAACSEVEHGDGPLAPTLARSPESLFPGGGYGPVNNDQGAIRLPQRFQAQVISAIGDPMTDGRPTPLAFDGMGCFSRGRETRLIRNHEDRNGVTTPLASRAYDPVAGGGTSTLVLGKDNELIASWISLAGTAVNCAGGVTPWDSWLTCEETVVGPREGYQKTHGWVFEVPASATGPADAVPIKAMGRFAHEALCVDHRTGIIYQTEDNGFPPGSGLFRYLPNNPRMNGPVDPNGRLQMARVMGHPRMELWRGSALGVSPGATLRVDWVDIPFVDPGDTTNEATRKAALFMQGYDQGGVAFNRLEGCWFGKDSLFFQDTRGGSPVQRGHVWRYTPGNHEGKGGQRDFGFLTLVFESPGSGVLDSPDNITVSPRGGLLICEDGSGTQWLRGLSASGQIFDFGLNILNDAEFAGACFGKDGTLFVNIQGETSGSPTATGVRGSGVTIAIWGPWERGAL